MTGAMSACHETDSTAQRGKIVKVVNWLNYSEKQVESREDSV